MLEWVRKRLRVADLREAEGAFIFTNGNYLECRQPNRADRMFGLTHDDVCLPCACKKEMERRGIVVTDHGDGVFSGEVEESPKVQP